jgi:hypothetical protein
MKDRKLFMWVNLFTFIFTLIVNFLAANLPLNELTTGEISDMFDIFFVPAGYVFAIWGLIYLGLLGFVIYQALPVNRDNQRLAKIDGWFSLSNIANALWLVSFHYLQFGLALALMLVLLLSLIMIFLRLDIGREKVKGASLWLVNVPFSIYLGWITVATIANATQLLYVTGWNGFGFAPAIWLVIMLAAAVVISGLMSFKRRNISHALVLIWAFAGIAVKFPENPTVSFSAWGAAALVGFLLVVALITKPRLT